MFKIQRSRIIYEILAELCRYWLIAGLLYFIAVGAEIEILKRVIEFYVIGMPIAVSVAFLLILGTAIYVYILNRWHWERPIIVDTQMQARINRLSITDVRVDERDLRHLTYEQKQQQATYYQ